MVGCLSSRRPNQAFPLSIRTQVCFFGFDWKFIVVAFIGCLSGIIWEFFRDSLGAYWESAMT